MIIFVKIVDFIIIELIFLWETDLNTDMTIFELFFIDFIFFNFL